MLKPLIIALLLFLQLALYSQNSLTDLPQTIDWVRDNITSNKDSSLLFQKGHWSKIKAEGEKSNPLIIDSYFNLALAHRFYESLDSALHYLTLSKAILMRSHNDSMLAEVHLESEAIFKDKAEYNKSMQSNFAALKLFEKLNNKKGVAMCYTRLCDLLYYEDNYQGGIDYCNRAISIQNEINELEEMAISYRYRADNELMLETREIALSSINEAIDIMDKLNKPEIDIIPYYNTRGNIYKLMGRYDDALRAYQYNYDVIKENSTLEMDLISSLGNIGHVYVLQNQYKKAIPYSLEAIEIMKRTGNNRNLWENYMHVSKAYKETGNYRKALEYNELYSEGHSKFQRNTIDNLESELKVKYETAKKDETIVAQDTMISGQRKTQFMIGSIAVLLGIILFGLYFIYKKRLKQNEKLQELNDVLDIRNKQNELLLKEIHHRVKNNLEMVKSLLALQSAKMENSESKDAMLASQNRVQSMGIIHQKLYQGENLGSIEMKDYFHNLGEGILDAYNAEDKVIINCSMDQLELDVDTAVPIGLIVNELLTNSLKYAFPDGQNGEIDITLSRPDSAKLILEVKDNGVGKAKDSVAQGTGFGTQLVDLLTRQLNGKLTEVVNQGTRFTFEFKLKFAA